MWEFICDTCGKSFKSKHLPHRSKHHFCSLKCKSIFFSGKNKYKIDGDTTTIYSDRGSFCAIIDTEDLEKIKDFYVFIDSNYVKIRTESEQNLAGFILDCKHKEDKSMFLDGNQFNCKKSNLAIVTQSEKMECVEISKRNSTGVKGVCFDKSRNKFKADICKDGVHYRLGRFNTLEEAKEAREEAEKILHKHGTYIKEYRENLKQN